MASLDDAAVAREVVDVWIHTAIQYPDFLSVDELLLLSDERWTVVDPDSLKAALSSWLTWSLARKNHHEEETPALKDVLRVAEVLVKIQTLGTTDSMTLEERIDACINDHNGSANDIREQALGVAKGIVEELHRNGGLLNAAAELVEELGIEIEALRRVEEGEWQGE